MIRSVLIYEFFALEDEEGEQMDNEIHFIDAFAPFCKLGETLHVA